MSEKIKNVTAAVLCGGKSSRMGFDKAFLKDHEQYLLVQTVQKLQTLFTQVVLISNTKTKFSDQKEFCGIPVFEDLFSEKGPIGGISTALKQAQTEYVFIMACDMPLPDVNLIGKMYRGLNLEQVFVCSYRKKPEPLFAFYHKSCLPVFEKHIEKGELRPRSTFSFLKVGIYELNDEEKKSIVNLNTPKDIQKWNQTNNKQ